VYTLPELRDVDKGESRFRSGGISRQLCMYTLPELRGLDKGESLFRRDG
jgi:hypothetical protein